MAVSFITLADVKIYNDYDYIELSAPTTSEKEPTFVNGETWLDTSTGFSYQLTNQAAGTWERIEKAVDTQINLWKDNTFETILIYLSNRFYIRRNVNYSDEYESSPEFVRNRKQLFNLYNYESVFSDFEFTASTKKITVVTDATLYGSITESFTTGDLIYVFDSQRNNGYYTIASLTSTEIEVNETIVDDTANCFIFLANVPDALVQIVSKLIWYDVFVRNKYGGLKSERIGTYSYTVQDVDPNLGYPVDLMAQLERYSLIDVGGEAVFVE